MKNSLLTLLLLVVLNLLFSAINTQAQTGPSYPIIWINKIGVNTSGDILTKNLDSHTWTHSGAASSNILPANTDGWMEFTTASSSDFIIGLAVNNIIHNAEFTNCIYIQNSGNNSFSYEGATATGLGSWQTGDIFKISREGNSVIYYRNGVVLRTVTVDPALVLKVKVTIQYPGKSTPDISTSFDAQLVLQGTVTGMEGNNGSGSISMNVTGGTEPYTYSWSNGEQTSMISNKPQGSYTVIVSDAVGRTRSRTYGLGYKINWINKIGVDTSGDILTKNLGTYTWTHSGAVSLNTLPANTDGWMEFSTESSSDFIIGLAVNNTIDYTEFTNGIRILNSGSSSVAREGTAATESGLWQTGDVFRISREGNSVNYYRNGAVLRTVTVNPALVLKVKVTILYPGNSTPNISTSFDAQLVLQGTVTGMEGNSGSGSISMNVTGGTAPYTYNWSSGEQTSMISNKPQGSYTVTVSDAVGRTRSRTYGLGYKINWINKIGVNTSGDILTKNLGSHTWTHSGAVSSNILPANTDGWMEFTTASSSDFIIGLAVNNTIDNREFTNGIRIVNSGSSSAALEGTASSGLGLWQTGDVFRISREGNSVIYYRNGTVLRTVTVDPALVLKVKVTIQYPGKSTPDISTSFDAQLVLQGTVTGMEGNSGSGSISMNVTGGTAPYTYSWSNGEQTSMISNKPQGSYIVTVSDAVGRTRSRTYGLGYKINWINKIGVDTNGDILTKNLGTHSWFQSGAISSNILPANTDGWMEFSTTSSSDFIIGLAVNNTINYSEFTNGVRILNSGSSSVAFEGTASTGLGLWQTGDVFRISREGNSVIYYRNGVVLRTVTVNPALALKVKVTIQYPGNSTPNLTTSFWLSDGIVRTYYAIASGNWTDASIWSLSENGPPSSVYPDDIDKVVIKGHSVTINSTIRSAGIIITSTNENTRLLVDGNMGALTVKGNIVMNREQGSNTAEVLLVQNDGRLDVKNQ